MKIRVGFVSNSSSSSFIIFGNDISIRDVNPKMLEDKQFFAIGDYLSEGSDVILIDTIEKLAFLKALDSNHNSEYSFDIIEAYETGDGYPGEINAEKLPKTGKIRYFSVEKDYHSSEDLDDLQRRYDSYGSTTKKMQKYLRGKKINKIENSKI